MGSGKNKLVGACVRVSRAVSKRRFRVVVYSHNMLRLLLKWQRLKADPAAVLRRRLGYAEAVSLKEQYLSVLNGRGGDAELYNAFKKLPSSFFSSWSLAPGSLVYLYRELKHARPKAILDCGSGASTVAIALLYQEAVGCGTTLISIDEDARWLEKTEQALESAGLANVMTLVHCPIAKFSLAGTIPESYDITRVAELLYENKKLEFVFIDGPSPAAGRGGVVPAFAPFITQGAQILLDDAARDGEAEYIRQWCKEGLVRFKGFVPTGSGLAIMEKLK